MQKSLKIVIVDDEEVNVILLETLLEQQQFHDVRSFLDPLMAKEYLLENECDILLVDYNMPLLNGSRLIQEIKKHNADLISMMITADQSNETMLSALEAGANDVLLKPISSNAFKLKLRNMTQLATSLKVTKQMNTTLRDEASFYQNLSQTKATQAAQYEALINSSSAFIRWDMELNIIDINDVYAAILQKEKYALIGNSIIDYLEENFQTEKFTPIWKNLQKEGHYKGIITLCIDRAHHYIDSSIQAIHNEAGVIVEYMSVGHEVTELITIQEEIKKTQEDVVFTMGSIGETRSRETGNHVKRVAEYSKLLALLYGLSHEEAELLKTASPMHDIGKVGIADSILNKPGKLTPEEFEIMKTHANLGYQMLKHSDRPILKTAALVAREHHEKYDGSGYPKGKKGEEIHIFGRITALADVFDALGSDRCYKKAWSDEDIFALLKEQRAKHFDPKLVDLFFAHLPRFLEIRDRLSDM